jgi:hypothetical protein
MDAVVAVAVRMKARRRSEHILKGSKQAVEEVRVGGAHGVQAVLRLVVPAGRPEAVPQDAPVPVLERQAEVVEIPQDGPQGTQELHT